MNNFFTKIFSFLKKRTNFLSKKETNNSFDYKYYLSKINNTKIKELKVKQLNEIDCIIHGHKWTSDFDPKKEISKPVTKRVYCKHCGVYYHEHVYHN